MPSILGTSSASNVYAQVAGLKGDNGSQKGGFGDVLSKALKESSESVKQNEKLATGQVYDKVDITKLTTDTAQLDVMVTTITALRDKVVAAIQELQKMQI